MALTAKRCAFHFPWCWGRDISTITTINTEKVARMQQPSNKSSGTEGRVTGKRLADEDSEDFFLKPHAY
jgi:hypothetical protein